MPVKPLAPKVEQSPKAPTAKLPETNGSDRFEKAVRFVLLHEDDNYLTRPKVERDPNDPGGTTKYGIDQRSHPNVNIAALTLNEAKAIYRRSYWDANLCSELPLGVGEVTFDTAVNCGSGAAGKFLQEAVGVSKDGKIGKLTVEATRRVQDSENLAYRLITRREAYYRSLRQFPRYGRGWLNRCADLRAWLKKEVFHG